MTSLHERAGAAAGSPEIRWFSAGSRGPAVLLVMGLGMRGEMWRPQIEGLRGAHRLAWFDHRGVGESGPTPSRRLRMHDMARDALRVADALAADARASGAEPDAWERFHLVGVSMGGMVAQEVALRAPARVRSLTLIATFGGGPLHGRLPTAEGLRAFVAANLAREPGARVRALQALLYPPEYLASADRAALGARMRAQLSGRVPPRTLLGQLHAVFRHDALERLPALTLPALVVRPGRDVLVRPAHSDALLARLPHARQLVLPDAGHGVIFQRAPELNAAIAALIADVERDASGP